MSCSVKPLADRAAQVRAATVASLIAYGTPAGTYVEAFRTEGIPDGDMPRITVATEEDYEGIETAPPGFNVTLSLVISAFSERARREDAIAEIDALVAQIREALFGDPCWVKQFSRIASVKVVRHWENRAERLLATAHTLITATWLERYPPRVPDILTGIDTTISEPPSAPIVLKTDFPAPAPPNP